MGQGIAAGGGCSGRAIARWRGARAGRGDGRVEIGPSADPEQAASWVAQLPVGDLRTTAADTIIGSWARQDPAAASAWIAKLPDGSGRERAVATFANSVAYDNPQLAWQWASTLTVESLRQGLLENAAQGWMRVDAPAARSAIAASGLPDYAKDRLLKPAQ